MKNQPIAAAVPLIAVVVWGIVAFYLQPALKEALLGPDSRIVPSLMVSAILSVLQIGIAIGLTMIIAAQGPAETLRELGVRTEILRPIAFALLATLPVWIFLWAVTGLVPLPSPTTFAANLVMALAVGMFDMAFVFGQFHRRAHLAFAPAAFIAAVVLALVEHFVHLAQIDMPAQIAGALIAVRVVTMLLFFWIFVRFRHSAWPVIAILVLIPEIDAASLTRDADLSVISTALVVVRTLPWIIAALLLLAGPHLPGLRRIVPAVASPAPAERPQDAF